MNLGDSMSITLTSEDSEPVVCSRSSERCVDDLKSSDIVELTVLLTLCWDVLVDD